MARGLVGWCSCNITRPCVCIHPPRAVALLSVQCKRHPECLAHVWVSGSPDQLRRCVSQSDTVRLLLRRAAQSPADEPTKPANGPEPMPCAPTRAPAGIDPRTDLIPLAHRSTAYLDQHTSVPGSAQGTSRTPPLVTLVLVSRTSCFRPIHPSWAPRNQESGIPCQGIPLRRSAVRRKNPYFLTQWRDEC